MNVFERDALYGVKVPDRRMAHRVDFDRLERSLLAMANVLRPAVERAVRAFEEFGRTLAGVKLRLRQRYNEKLKKRRPRHRPRWINGRLRPLTRAERAKKKEKRRGRLQDRSGTTP